MSQTLHRWLYATRSSVGENPATKANHGHANGALRAPVDRARLCVAAVPLL
jgi:hypothetical protein